MGLFDKAKDALSSNSDKVQDGVEKGGDFVDEKTGGEHSDKVDQGQEFVKDQLGNNEGNQQ